MPFDDRVVTYYNSLNFTGQFDRKLPLLSYGLSPALSNLVIQNPKRINTAIGRASWYHYYPSFSLSFAHSLLRSVKLPQNSVVLDPWNGSGTTTSSASSLGYQAIGIDLNPVMVIAAKARLLGKTEKDSLSPLAWEILIKAEDFRKSIAIEDDPLNSWLLPQSAKFLRMLEMAIYQLLVDEKGYRPIASSKSLDDISCLAAFYYAALFRAARKLLGRFFSSNPTWTKLPTSAAYRVRPDWNSIRLEFNEQVKSMIVQLENDPYGDSDADVKIRKGSSESLPIANESIDFVLTSPPYCTRIDYAVATRIELALLGYKANGTFDDLRRNLIGTSTTSSASLAPSPLWGKTCLSFLTRLKSHNSKASHSYYYRNHLQYFYAIQRSLQEISRILKRSSSCVLVVQDSYYKEIHNNLPKIIAEMFDATGLDLNQRKDFVLHRTMAGIHPGSKKYRQIFRATESVLCFIKT